VRVINCILFLFLLVILISCNKKEEKVIGCTDPNAINYNPEATSIPGSDMAHCIYDTTCPSVISISFFDSTNIPMDTYFIDTAYLVDGILHTTVNYAGGCENHLFNLYSEEVFCGTPPCYINFVLSHNSNNESCEANLTENLCFDISDYLGNQNYLSLYNPENNSYINFY